MNWISVNDQMPETQKRVLVCFTNKYGKTWVTCAEYIAPRSILEADYMDHEYTDGGDYDEDEDCYWTNSGFYEHNYEPDVNWFINEKITHWMPLPEPQEVST